MSRHLCRLIRFHFPLGIGALVLLSSCQGGPDLLGESSPQSASLEEVPVIGSVSPDQGSPGQRLRVLVTGSGFEPGTVISIERPELTGAVVVDSLTVRSADSIVAFIRVSETGPKLAYNVVARTPRGRKGIGTEKFKVVLVQDLGPGSAVGVNAAGTVIGYTLADRRTCSRPFSYSALGGMVFLRGPKNEECGGSPRAINESGVVVGSFAGEGAVVWVGGLRAQPLLAEGHSESGDASDVNASGLVVGTTGQLDPPSNLIRPAASCWKNGQGIVLQVQRPLIGSTAKRVNSAGDAVGWAQPNLFWGSPSEDAVPMVFRCGLPSPTAVPLPMPLGATGGVATAIADDGTIYGYVQRDGQELVMRWLPSPAGGWSASASLPASFPGRVVSVTRSGRVVGWYYEKGTASWEARTWVYQPGAGMFDVSGLTNNARAMAAADDGVGGQLRLAGQLQTPEYSGIAYWPDALYAAFAMGAASRVRAPAAARGSPPANLVGPPPFLKSIQWRY